ncbi:MAG: Gfo/Idh/MocA family oxidoreductase [bacterium]|nr:Gfo/Idh/MocA family oxidoreductase [bacterium]
MKQINWGIIGCGNVTEVKSGPAFNRVKDSALVAVMRRDGAKAEDYAKRHGVPRWYGDAEELIHDPGVNAVYVATPPDSHARYAIMAAEAGNHVYVEKPIALNFGECEAMMRAAEKNGVSLFVAYYRRCLPYFLKVKELVDTGVIGTPRLVEIRFFKPGPKEKIKESELPWRLKPGISGGGLFVDLGSHQLDFLDYLFGPIVSVKGFARNQAGLYPPEDIVGASFVFETGVHGSGTWCFTVSEKNDTDEIIILGTEGKISFSTFKFTPIIVETGRGIVTFDFPRLKHIQEALIQTVVDELLGRGECPSTGITASRTTRVMDEILR